MSEDDYEELLEHQKENPIQVMKDRETRRTWWMFKDEFYWENEGYTETEVKALILERQRKKEKKVKRAIAKMKQEESLASTTNREPIPEDVQMFVWRRDEGKCVKCGSKENLEFDHIIPLSKGGSNTARNIQLLCESCNRSKGDSIG